MFQPDLPPPPKCTAYDALEQIHVDDPNASSSEEDPYLSDDDEEEGMVESAGKSEDYYNI